MKRSRLGALPGFLVAAATFAVFLPALGGGFLNWDDDENFLWNPHYRGLGWANLRWMFTAVHQGLYVPVAWLTLGLDHVIWGMEPWGYHLTSVIFHAANAGLLYAVARRLLAAACPERREGRAAGAALAALLFAIHPLRVESVAWVTERRDVVAGFLSLASVLAYLTAWRRGRDGRLAPHWYWTAVGAFALALLAKSIVVGLPLVLLALDWYPLRRTRPLRTLLLEKVPFLAPSIAVSAITLGILSARDLMASWSTLGIWERLAVSAYGLGFYLWKSVVPGPLSPVYPITLPVVPWSARYLVPAIVVVAITVGVLVLRRRWPAGAVTWVTYVALVAPVLGLFHSGPQIAADRYSYFACLGPAVLAGGGFAWCLRATREGRLSRVVSAAAVAGVSVLLVALATLTVGQIGVWRSSETLWRHAALVNPESDIPVFYLGWALADSGRLDESRSHFTRALDRVPSGMPALRAQVLLHRGIVAQRAGASQAAEEDYQQVLALDPRHPVAVVRLGIVADASGNEARAEQLFSRAAALAPLWPHYQLWEIRAAVAEVQPRHTPGRAALGKALGRLLHQAQALDQAEAQFRLVVSLTPDDASAWNELGLIQARQQRHTDAVEAFVRALRAEPRHAAACENGRRAAAAAHQRRPEIDACGRDARS